ncbi:hypothetical protein KC352_g37491, partial [Hortaea werneckii]
ARELGGSYNHADVPFDDDLVPVLDQPTGSEKERVPTRVISGRKDVGGKNGNDDVAKANRRCMCCDSRVMVPKDLDKFRCMGCTTVNDLRPASEQRKEQKRAEAEGFGGQIGGRTVQVNVERVQAVIDKCVVSYLEERCRRTSQPAKPPLGSRAVPQPAQTSPARAGDSAGTAAIPIKQPKKGSQQLTDAPVSSSPPDRLDHEDLLASKHSATIKDFKDIDFFSYMRYDTPPPYEQVTRQGSDSTPGAASVGEEARSGETDTEAASTTRSHLTAQFFTATESYKWRDVTWRQSAGSVKSTETNADESSPAANAGIVGKAAVRENEGHISPIRRLPVGLLWDI